MLQTTQRSRAYPPSVLRESCRQAFLAAGVPDIDAALVADALVAADQCGIYSHGLIRLPLYVAALEAGGMNPTPMLRWRKEVGATAVLDADSAMGQVAMRAAIERAITLTHGFGVATVAVEHSTHYGAGRYWSDRLIEAGLVGIVTSTTGPVVAPFRGRDAILGTNPLTIAMPSAGTHALTADMATSAGAYGKVLAARNVGDTIPDGWAVGPDGEPTTDPAAAIEGSLLAFGGHKGSAVSVLLEALAASLTEANFAFQTVDIWSNPSNRMNTGHLVIAIDPEFFNGLQHTRERVATLQERVRTSNRDGVQSPGDPEVERFAANSDRIELAETTCAGIDSLLDRLGIARPLPLDTT